MAKRLLQSAKKTDLSTPSSKRNNRMEQAKRAKEIVGEIHREIKNTVKIAL